MMNFGFSDLSLGGAQATSAVMQQQQPGATQTAKQTHAVAVLVPGRPVLFEWDQVDPTHLVGDLPNPGQVTDLSFFLLPEATLPPESGAAIHFSLPPYTHWTVLGAIHPGCPSTTVRTGFQTPDVVDALHVRLGVSIEPIDVIRNLEQSHAISTTVDRGEWGKKLAQDLYNYLSSFTQVTPQGETIVCPVQVLNKWLKNVDPSYTFHSIMRTSISLCVPPFIIDLQTFHTVTCEEALHRSMVFPRE